MTKKAHRSRITQLSMFLENKLGALRRVLTILEEAHVRACALSILDAADHAVARMVVNRPGPAREALQTAGYSVFETEVLGVALPGKEQEDFEVGRLLSALLVSEINVKYLYALIIQVDGRPVIAVRVDDMDAAARVLTKAGLTLVGQEDIDWGEPV
jgi:hypothetical protein